MTWLLVVLAVGVTCLPMRAISEQSFARTRDWFLLSLLALGTIWAVWVAPPFAPVGLYFLCRWREHGMVSQLVTWAALGAFWVTLASLPQEAWPWVATGWYLAASGASGLLVVEYLRADKGHNPWWHPFRYLDTARAWFGQRTLAGAFCATLLPFFPLKLMWIPALGLLVTCSWTALLGAAAALAMLWPWTAIPSVTLGACVGVAAVYYPKILWLTPRGQSLDGLKQRVFATSLTLHKIANRRWLPWGYGPRTMPYQTWVWAAKHGGDRIPLGNLHNEPLQFFYEYGPLAVVSCALLCFGVLPHLRLGDPWSAAWVAGGVVSLGCVNFRAVNTGLPWLAISVYLWRWG